MFMEQATMFCKTGIYGEEEGSPTLVRRPSVGEGSPTLVRRPSVGVCAGRFCAERSRRQARIFVVVGDPVSKSNGVMSHYVSDCRSRYHAGHDSPIYAKVYSTTL